MGKIESLLDEYSIKPIVGIVPNNQDKTLINKYNKDFKLWERAKIWQSRRWIIGLHGYTHVYFTDCAGINPIHNRSEFAGVPLEEQKKKISKGIKVFKQHGLNAKVFFAPSHTFDENTLEALLTESGIRIISDTIANGVYKDGEFHFIPQQFDRVRKTPFKVTTFCYHPNTMNENDFQILKAFIKKNSNKFVSFEKLSFTGKELNFYDKFLKRSCFAFRTIHRRLRGT